MLEKALAPQKVNAVAQLFAKENKERNGAVQFMLFSDQLKNKTDLSQKFWITEFREH